MPVGEACETKHEWYRGGQASRNQEDPTCEGGNPVRLQATGGCQRCNSSKDQIAYDLILVCFFLHNSRVTSTEIYCKHRGQDIALNVCPLATPLLTPSNLRRKPSSRPAIMYKQVIDSVKPGSGQALRGSDCPPPRALLVNLEDYP